MTSLFVLIGKSTEIYILDEQITIYIYNYTYYILLRYKSYKWAFSGTKLPG